MVLDHRVGTFMGRASALVARCGDERAIQARCAVPYLTDNSTVSRFGLHPYPPLLGLPHNKPTRRTLLLAPPGPTIVGMEIEIAYDPMDDATELMLRKREQLIRDTPRPDTDSLRWRLEQRGV